MIAAGPTGHSYLVAYRPGTGTIRILQHNQNGNFTSFSTEQGDPGYEIGGYDLRSHADRIITFDFDHTGNDNHLVLYRPTSGKICILKNINGHFKACYQNNGLGIGGYDLKSWNDRAFAFDYDSTGRNDHLVFYRPGTGTFWILKNEEGNFRPVYKEGDPGSGIGGYNLSSPTDRAIAFDYDHSEKLDHIVLYRPGSGTIWILKNANGKFIPVYKQGDPGTAIGTHGLRNLGYVCDRTGRQDYIGVCDTGSFNGIGGYDLLSPADRVFAYDYESSRRQDHLALYRPGTGTFWILKNENGYFSPVYKEGDPGIGIGGYDLRSPGDRVFPFDFDRTGYLNHLVLYRPGTGVLWIIRNINGNFTCVHAYKGTGIGGYDLKSSGDKLFSFNYASSLISTFQHTLKHDRESVMLDVNKSVSVKLTALGDKVNSIFETTQEIKILVAELQGTLQNQGRIIMALQNENKRLQIEAKEQRLA